MNDKTANDTAIEKSAFPTQVQMLLLQEPLKTTAKALESHLQSSFGENSITVQGREDNSDSFMLQWGRKTFVLMCIDQPIPADNFNVALRTSFGLKNGEQIVKTHKAHLILSPLNTNQNQLEAIFSAIGLMAIAHQLSRLAPVLAYYWASADILFDETQFAPAMVGADKAMDMHIKGEPNPWYQLPTTYWVGIRMLSPDQKTVFGAVTHGLAAITGFEIVIEPFKTTPGTVAQHLFGMASYALNRGPLLKDNDTIGIDGMQQFRVRKGPHAPGRSPHWVMSIEAVQ